MRNIRSAPAPKVNMAKRVLLMSLLGIFVLVGGSALAAFAWVSTVNLPALDPNVFLSTENSVILASNHTLLKQSIDPNVGSRVLKPLELNPRNHKQCPQGRHTQLARFRIKFGRDNLQYLTCNGWGIPPKVANATIATEDPTFYSNPGFDALSILRATLQDVTSGQIQSGASTIAQQLAKQFILRDSSPTLDRKAKEIVIAYRLTQKYPKKFILYLYLNSVFYGFHSWGVGAAAESYFHKDVSKLKLWQAAMIAGLPQLPSVYDPFNASSLSTSGQYPAWYLRMSEVLNFLQQRGYIRASQRRVALAEAGKYRFYADSVQKIRDYAFVTFMQEQLQSLIDPDNGPRGFDPYLTHALGGRNLTSGLKIITTLRPQLQAVAQSDVDAQVAALDNPVDNVSDGALVSINLRHGCYGCIMAMVGNGGHDTQHAEINMANTPRQPGSSFKVFNYVSAFEKGLSPASVVLDEPVNIPDSNSPTGYYSPTNYSLTYSGLHTIRYALDNSLNVPAVKTELWNGPNTIARTAHKFGITDFWKDNPNCCKGLYATTLGGLAGGVRLVQETQAYGAFGTGGINVPAISFTKIIDRATGKVLWRLSQDTWFRHWDHKRVAPAADVYMISSILSDNITRAPEFGADGYLNIAPYTAAAKTGTTSSFKDNWTEGYTPQIVTGVWVGNADDAAMGYGVSGITGAAPIWHTFMLQAFPMLHLQNLPFNPPPGTTTSAQCLEEPYAGQAQYSGPFLTDYDPSTGADAATFVQGKTPLCQVPAVPGLDAPSYTYTQAQPTPTPAIPGLLP